MNSSTKRQCDRAHLVGLGLICITHKYIRTKCVIQMLGVTYLCAVLDDGEVVLGRDLGYDDSRSAKGAVGG